MKDPLDKTIEITKPSFGFELFMTHMFKKVMNKDLHKKVVHLLVSSGEDSGLDGSLREGTCLSCKVATWHSVNMRETLKSAEPGTEFFEICTDCCDRELQALGAPSLYRLVLPEIKQEDIQKLKQAGLL